MQIATHSNDHLFTAPLKKYAEEKLARPIERHKLDKPPTSLDVEAHNRGESTELKIRISLAGLTPFTVQVAHEDAYAAIDLAADKIERVVREFQEKRRARNRRKVAAGARLDDETEDIFTEGEEQVLREMGALDAVLEA